MPENKALSAARATAEKVAELGGRTYFVGGCVRDGLLGIESKDIDIEVHGVTADQLQSVLDSLGERITVGQSFGIFALKGVPLDIAMPRKEKTTGQGHRDFSVDVDPFIGTLASSRRRDFTINAMMRDVLTSELIDHFNGREDLQNRVIRHVDQSTFSDDPLRVLRAAQFAARFDFKIADETAELCRKIDLLKLSKERVCDELKKAMLKADRPSVFFETLKTTDQLGVWFNEVADLINVRQTPVYHLEGDVWTHTMMVLDAAAKYRDRAAYPFAFMLAALCHDFGKAVCTVETDGKITSHGHEITGLPLIDTFIKRLTDERDINRYVKNLAKLHMRPGQLAAANASVKSTNRMFDECVDCEGLICLSLSDSQGKLPKADTTAAEAFLRERLAAYNEYMSRPYVTGNDLIEAGIPPAEGFSEILGYAHKLRLSGVDKESALKQTLAYAKKRP